MDMRLLVSIQNHGMIHNTDSNLFKILIKIPLLISVYSFQVLPDRTHPEVMMNNASGFLLSGYVLK